ncbi:MAG: PilW family protein [Pseudomonadota bacterium]
MRANRRSLRLGVRRASAGFSLIELMIALTLGLVVTAGIVQLFVGNNRTNELINGQSRLQESARYALDFMSRSTRNAGFYGCDPDDDKIYNTLNADWNQLFELDLQVPVEGFDGTGAGNAIGDWTPTLNELPRNAGGSSPNAIIAGNGIDIDSLVPSSDILVVRYQVPPGHRIATMVAPFDDPIVEDNGNVGFENGDYAVISNCEQAALFQVTNVSSGGGGVTLTRGTGVGVYANSAAKSLSEIGIEYGNAFDDQGSVVSEIVADIYFVADGAGSNNRGAVTQALWRKRGTDAPLELVEGISDLQVLFGIDTTPNDNLSSANRYVPFGGVGTNQIRSVRVTIEANTIDVVSDAATPISRRFTQTINVRN